MELVSQPKSEESSYTHRQLDQGYQFLSDQFHFHNAGYMVGFAAKIQVFAQIFFVKIKEFISDLISWGFNRKEKEILDLFERCVQLVFQIQSYVDTHNYLLQSSKHYVGKKSLVLNNMRSEFSNTFIETALLLSVYFQKNTKKVIHRLKRRILNRYPRSGIERGILVSHVVLKSKIDERFHQVIPPIGGQEQARIYQEGIESCKSLGKEGESFKQYFEKRLLELKESFEHRKEIFHSDQGAFHGSEADLNQATHARVQGLVQSIFRFFSSRQ